MSGYEGEKALVEDSLGRIARYIVIYMYVCRLYFVALIHFRRICCSVWIACICWNCTRLLNFTWDFFLFILSPTLNFPCSKCLLSIVIHSMTRSREQYGLQILRLLKSSYPIRTPSPSILAFWRYPQGSVGGNGIALFNTFFFLFRDLMGFCTEHDGLCSAVVHISQYSILVLNALFSNTCYLLVIRLLSARSRVPFRTQKLPVLVCFLCYLGKWSHVVCCWESTREP